MFGVRLFPPQVLSDLNFLSVNSKEELATRLRAVQRVAVAAIGAYLWVRYLPILAAKLGSSCAAGMVVELAFFVSGACLSYPAAALILAGSRGYLFTMYAVSRIRNKEIGWTVFSVAWIGLSYFWSQDYKMYAEIGPNFLERVFQKVEDKLTQPLWDRFYKI